MMDLDQTECTATTKAEQWSLDDSNCETGVHQCTSFNCDTLGLVQSHHGEVGFIYPDRSHALIGSLLQMPDCPMDET